MTQSTVAIVQDAPTSPAELLQTPEGMRRPMYASAQGRTVEPRACERCGTQFLIFPWDNQRFCSLSCAALTRAGVPLVWTEKRCTTCQVLQPIGNFYMNKGGTQPGATCKRCNADRRRSYNANNRSKTQAYSTAWMAEHPEVKRAMRRIAHELRMGRLVRPTTCEECKATDRRIEAAHHDYSRPFDVRWLCVSCHRRWDTAEPKAKGAVA